MKHLSLALLLGAAAFSMNAEKPHHLIGFKDQVGYYEEYIFNEDQKILQIYENEPGYDQIRWQFSYDENGRQTRREMFELYSKQVWHSIGYGSLEYNEKGQLYKVSNYNIDIYNNESLSHVREYIYNEDGTLQKMIAWHGKDLTKEYSVADYTYDENHHVASVTQYMRDRPTDADLYKTSFTEYTHYDDGRISSMETTSYDQWSGNEIINKGTTFEWDKDGNISLITYANGSEIYAYHTFKYYDLVDNEEVLYPYFLQLDMDIDDTRTLDFYPFFNCKNPMRVREDYKRDFETGQIVVANRRAFRYDDALMESSVETVAVEQGELAVSMRGDVMSLRGVNAGETVSVYDLSGRLIASFDYQGARYILLPKGVLIAKVGTRSAKFTN